MISSKYRQIFSMSTLSETADTYEPSDIYRGNKVKEKDLAK